MRKDISKMAPILYMVPSSPPSRAVLMTAKSIGLELNLQEINPIRGENKTPEYLKINPQHTIPTLVDEDGFVIWDSHAIMIYILEKYSKDDSLYPKDIRKRAVVNNRLHFDCGVVWTRCLDIFVPIIFEEQTVIEQKKIDAIHEAYGFLEVFLEGNQWAAGDSVTIADYSLSTSITAINLVVKIDAVKYPNITAWLQRVEVLPVNEVNSEGMKFLITFFNDFSNKLAK